VGEDLEIQKDEHFNPSLQNPTHTKPHTQSVKTIPLKGISDES